MRRESSHDKSSKTGAEICTHVKKEVRKATPRKVNQMTAGELRRAEIAYDIIEGAQNIVQISVPVSVCMLLVTVIMYLMEFYKEQTYYLPYTPFHSDSEETVVIVYESFLNTLILLGIIIMMTCLLLLLYRCRCYKILYAWLLMAGVMLMFYLQFRFILSVFEEFDWPLDYISGLLIMWNVAVTGMLSIFWRGPLRLQQMYLIVIAALLALFLVKHIPEWTVWAILVVISIWDLVAVLHPYGPLRKLVNIARERGDNVVPILVYSSAVAFIVSEVNQNESEKSENKSTNTDSSQKDKKVTVKPEEVKKKSVHIEKDVKQSANTKEEEEEEEEGGIKLGLGDMIFYSVLVAKTCARFNFATVVATMLSILIGLNLTLILLTVFRKALPALPIAILFGLIASFGLGYMGSPMADSFAIMHIFP